jgi:hypothetical protein
MEKLLNRGLLGIPNHGADAGTLDGLRRSLAVVDQMLAEKAVEHEQHRSLMLTASAEAEALLDVALAIGREAARLRATTLPAVLDKLAIWHGLTEDDGEDSDTAVRNGIVRSAIADLERVATPRRAPT